MVLNERFSFSSTRIWCPKLLSHGQTFDFLHNSSYPVKSCQGWHFMGFEHWVSILSGSCQNLAGIDEICKTLKYETISKLESQPARVVVNWICIKLKKRYYPVTNLYLICRIFIRPVPDDIPVKRLRVAGVTSDVLYCFGINSHIAFCYGLHPISGDNSG